MEETRNMYRIFMGRNVSMRGFIEDREKNGWILGASLKM
jgi:hypothetical protein